MKKSIIGLWGLDFTNPNLGCQALSYSFFSLLSETLVKLNIKGKVYVFMNQHRDFSGLTPDYEYENIEFSLIGYNRKQIKPMIKAIKECDVHFDFTGGDSFSDYYGFDRFARRTLLKSMIILNKKKLVLGPQTYGPYQNIVSHMWAKWVINKSYLVYSRDKASIKRLAKYIKREIRLVTDVAFALPYDDSYKTNTEKIKIGINISGLLYMGGYNGKNQFGLTVDYPSYAEQLIRNLYENEKYEIHLIPHANNERGNDNDLLPCRELVKKYPKCHVAPHFNNPVEIKSYISNMDIFTGARMHATIAAFSSGVATIPFSYSVKFEGLFGSSGYNKCIDGKKLNTDDAVQLTLNYVETYDELISLANKSIKYMDEKLLKFKKDLLDILSTTI